MAISFSWGYCLSRASLCNFLSVILKALERKSLLISSSSFISSDESKASLRTFAEKMVKVSKKLMSGRLFDSIFDLNWMNDLLFSKAVFDREAFLKMTQL